MDNMQNQNMGNPVPQGMPNQNMNQKKKISGAIIALAVGGAALSAIMLFSFVALILVALLGDEDYKVNKAAKETGMPVAKSMRLYSEEGLGYSFLYPAGTQTGADKDGVYIYGAAGSYVLIDKLEGRDMTPEKYFKASDEWIQSIFANAQSTEIHKVEIDDKNLYMTRYQCEGKDGICIIDRFVELYKDCYVQYLAVSDTAGSLNTPLYYAIKTLRLSDDAYEGAAGYTFTEYSQDDTGLAITMPDIFTVKELTIGYVARSEEAMLLFIKCIADDNGKAISSRQDFIERSLEDGNFVAGMIGVDSANFGACRQMDIGGTDFYCYPMELTADGVTQDGVLCLADAKDNGCILLYYSVNKDSVDHDEMLTLLGSCTESVRIH